MSGVALRNYRLLGRSGLRVSPLALGTMNFGSDPSQSVEKNEMRRIFDHYMELGGNLIDTANRYTDGVAEQLIGTFMAGRRDCLVVATKYTLPTRTSDPNSGGNHRKSMTSSVEMSLRHLATDYLDILFLHVWDATTPFEEILRAMDDLVRSGKVLYLGISNTPAWRVAAMQVMANLRGWSPLTVLQIEYSMIERGGERDLIPMARDLGLGVMTWGALGGGILSGNYSKADLQLSQAGRQSIRGRGAVLLDRGALTSRALDIAEAVKSISTEIGRSPSQVALAWTLLNAGVTAPIIGARTLEQLRDNLEALEVRFTDEQVARLEQISAIQLGYPHDYLKWVMRTEMMRACMCTTRRSP